MNHTTAATAAWDAHWTGIRDEDWLAAKQLLDLSPRVAGYYASHLTPTRPDGRGTGEAHLDWDAAASGIPEECFSSTERRLALLVAAVVTDAPVRLSDLGLMESWAVPVWQVLTSWATRGDLTVSELTVPGGSR